MKVLKEEIRSYTTDAFTKLMKDHLGNKAAEQESIVHQNVICDGCDLSPI